MESWHFLVLVLALPLKTLPLVTLAETNVYIVYMGDKLHDEPELVQESIMSFLLILLEAKTLRRNQFCNSYKHGFSGFAAVLTKSQEKLIAGVTMLVKFEISFHNFPGVAGVVRNRIISSHTTRSWDFLQVSLNLRVEFQGTFRGWFIIGVWTTGQWQDEASLYMARV
uniref:Inhibitor I9 domain-containing protein n=1 Tax=Salix viminalis TaxID=40686 RepID=A0A6N2LMK1_SALVM